jgi:hydrogenase maturation protease
MRAATLIVGFGNPSRGDDALGPAAIAEIERRMANHPAWGKVDILTDFQLQIEFVTDLADRRCIVFIDASANGAEPFLFEPLEARQENPITTHALSPASLLTVYRSFHGEDAPPSFLLGIRGYEFDLGLPLSIGAVSNLEAAITMLEQWLTEWLAIN